MEKDYKFSNLLAAFEVFYPASPGDRARFRAHAGDEARIIIEQVLEIIKVIETAKGAGSADAATDGVVASEATCDKPLDDAVKLLASMSPTDRDHILLTSRPDYQVLLVRAMSILEARKVAKTIAEQQLEIDSLKAALTAAKAELKVMYDGFGVLTSRLARSNAENS